MRNKKLLLTSLIIPITTIPVVASISCFADHVYYYASPDDELLDIEKERIGALNLKSSFGSGNNLTYFESSKTTNDLSYYGVTDSSLEENENFYYVFSHTRDDITIGMSSGTLDVTTHITSKKTGQVVKTHFNLIGFDSSYRPISLAAEKFESAVRTSDNSISTDSFSVDGEYTIAQLGLDDRKYYTSNITTTFIVKEIKDTSLVVDVKFALGSSYGIHWKRNVVIDGFAIYDDISKELARINDLVENNKIFANSATLFNFIVVDQPYTPVELGFSEHFTNSTITANTTLTMTPKSKNEADGSVVTEIKIASTLKPSDYKIITRTLYGFANSNAHMAYAKYKLSTAQDAFFSSKWQNDITIGTSYTQTQYGITLPYSFKNVDYAFVAKEKDKVNSKVNTDIIISSTTPSNTVKFICNVDVFMKSNQSYISEEVEFLKTQHGKDIKAPYDRMSPYEFKTKLSGTRELIQYFFPVDDKISRSSFTVTTIDEVALSVEIRASVSYNYNFTTWSETVIFSLKGFSDGKGAYDEEEAYLDSFNNNFTLSPTYSDIVPSKIHADEYKYIVNEIYPRLGRRVDYSVTRNSFDDTAGTMNVTITMTKDNHVKTIPNINLTGFASAANLLANEETWLKSFGDLSIEKGFDLNLPSTTLSQHYAIEKDKINEIKYRNTPQIEYKAITYVSHDNATGKVKIKITLVSGGITKYVTIDVKGFVKG